MNTEHFEIFPKKCLCYEIKHQAAIFAHQIKSGKLFRETKDVYKILQGRGMLVLCRFTQGFYLLPTTHKFISSFPPINVPG